MALFKYGETLCLMCSIYLLRCSSVCRCRYLWGAKKCCVSRELISQDILQLVLVSQVCQWLCAPGTAFRVFWNSGLESKIFRYSRAPYPEVGGREMWQGPRSGQNPVQWIIEAPFKRIWRVGIREVVPRLSCGGIGNGECLQFALLLLLVGSSRCIDLLRVHESKKCSLSLG